MHIIQEKWSEILNMIKVEHDVSDISFSTWLKPLKVYKILLWIILIRSISCL